jgi:hypothetical protein
MISNELLDEVEEQRLRVSGAGVAEALFLAIQIVAFTVSGLEFRVS